MYAKIHYVFFLLLGMSTLSCTEKKTSAFGEWAFSDFEYQVGFKTDLERLDNEEIWQYFVYELLDKDSQVDYQSLSADEKSGVKARILEEIEEEGRKAFEYLSYGAYFGFYKDSTFNGFVYPYYYQGIWTQEGDKVLINLSEMSSIVASTPIPKNFKKQIEFQLLDTETRNAFVLRSEDFPSAWALDTLYVNPRKKERFIA